MSRLAAGLQTGLFDINPPPIAIRTHRQLVIANHSVPQLNTICLPPHLGRQGDSDAASCDTNQRLSSLPSGSFGLGHFPAPIHCPLCPSHESARVGFASAKLEGLSVRRKDSCENVSISGTLTIRFSWRTLRTDTKDADWSVSFSVESGNAAALSDSVQDFSAGTPWI